MSTRESPSLAPEFQSICDLGRGGMGSVELVRLVGPGEFGRLCVLKRVRDDRRDEDARLRFLYEGRVAAAIRHSNVVRTQYVGCDERGVFLLLDYVEGASLEQLLTALAERGRHLSFDCALRIVLDALWGLAAVHEAHDLEGRPLALIHRDVTLQNLLIGLDGTTRVADFGIAKGAHSPVVTDQQYILGKLRFLPAEYVRREKVTQNMDVYSLGVCLWHALTGRALWGGASERELIEHLLVDDVPPVSTHVVVPRPLELLVGKACARNPEARFASAREMAQAIESSGVLVATHAAVGELVRELLGPSLQERRRLVAAVGERRVESPSAGAGQPAPLSVGSKAQPPPRSQRAVVFAAALLLVLAGVSLATLTSARVGHEPAREQSTDPVITPASASTGEPGASSLPASPVVRPVVSVAVPSNPASSAPTDLRPSHRAAVPSARGTATRPRAAIIVKNPYLE